MEDQHSYLSVLLICWLLFANSIFTIVIYILIRRANAEGHYFYYHFMRQEGINLPFNERYLIGLKFFREFYCRVGIGKADFNCLKNVILTDEENTKYQKKTNLLRTHYLANFLMVSPFIFIWIPMVAYLLYISYFRIP